jgi:hypothetical protein
MFLRGRAAASPSTIRDHHGDTDSVASPTSMMTVPCTGTVATTRDASEACEQADSTCLDILARNASRFRVRKLLVLAGRAAALSCAPAQDASRPRESPANTRPNPRLPPGADAAATFAWRARIVLSLDAVASCIRIGRRLAVIGRATPARRVGRAATPGR